jgi:hypothetical protein
VVGSVIEGELHMPVPISAATLAAIAPALAKHGLDLLSGMFRGALAKGTKEIVGLIEEKTGIDINDAAEDKLTEEQWAKLETEGIRVPIPGQAPRIPAAGRRPCARS